MLINNINFKYGSNEIYNNFNIEFNLCYKNHVFHDNLDSHAIITLIINGE